MKPLSATAATSTPLREEELVARAQEGNREAFEALFRRYREAITGYVRARFETTAAPRTSSRRSSSPRPAVSPRQPPASLRSWLYQIAQNACLDDARRRSRTDELILGWDGVPTAR